MTDIFKGILSPDQLRTVLELAETEAQATGRINDLPDTITTHPDDCRMCEAGEPMEHTYEPPGDGPEYPFIPLTGLVHDNSETVTDYAFMGHRSPNRGVVSPGLRDRTIDTARRFLRGYTHYQWTDVNQGNSAGWGAGQRCRFDMLVNADGTVVHLFHTEYFTRVACGVGDWCYSYATHYTVVVDSDGKPSDKVPYCDEHVREMRRNIHGLPMRLHLSEPLIIGQHD